MRLVTAIVAAVFTLSVAAIAATPIPTKSRPIGCNTDACEQRVKHRQLKRHYQRVWRAAPASVRAHLRRIAWCESTNKHRAISPGGTYRGLLQFLPSTWRAVGGRGDPAAATRWEQWSRGVRLYLTAGPGQWPVCSRT